MIFFKLFSNCIPVKGSKRSTIIDLQKGNTHFIPNDLFEILIKSDKIEVNHIYCEYGIENEEILKDYFETLIDLELGFYCSEKEIKFFPKISLDYQTPFKINNSIIEGLYEIDVYKNLITQLELLGCEYVELLLYYEIENSKLSLLLNLFEKSSIKYIGLILKFDETKDKDFIKSLTSKKLRVSKIILHSSTEDKILDHKDYNFAYINYSSKVIKDFNVCGIINVNYFSNKMNHFTESQNHNTCLNRKISIDKDGNIKNCPSMAESFGNIKDTTLEEALNKPGFKKYWNINKDQIEVCKDCEFRHICTDCRAYIEDPENQYSKPLKCGYNPYTNVWEEWSTNPLKQKAIEYYGMQDLVKKDLKT
jgi:SPASM domain peptide maturase of grasp-with-spasm system